jgi:acyl-CoA thioesterase I
MVPAWSVRPLLLVVAAFILGWVCVPQGVTAAGSDSATLLVVGDSLSAAYGLRQEEGWVELLQRRVTREKLHYNVVNASISGETTAGGLSRIPGLLARHRPSVVLIALGGNDGLRGTPLATMRTQLSAMIQLCLAHNARVVLAGVELPPNYGNAYAGDFNASFAAVARENRVPLVPSLLAGFGARSELFQADGVHPIAIAEPRILDNVWPVLRPVLSAKNRLTATFLPSVT